MKRIAIAIPILLLVGCSKPVPHVASATQNVIGGSTLTMWAMADPHVYTDWVNWQLRTVREAIRDSFGLGGGPGFAWDFGIIAGDFGGTPCPGNWLGGEVVAQLRGGGLTNASLFYALAGNHDAGASDLSWFERWLDPLGTNTAESEVDSAQRPFPVVAGTPEYYAIEAGNIRILMLSDQNEGGPPFGRTCSGGYPAGRVSKAAYDWWVSEVEAHQDKILITVAHQALLNTTIYTDYGEGVASGAHGSNSWADDAGSSMIYTIDNWTVDGLNVDKCPLGPRPYGFTEYLEAHPGAIDLWLHGHTHANTYPGKIDNGKGDIATKWGVTHVNLGALTRTHGAPDVSSSRIFDFVEGQAYVTMRTYLHNQGWTEPEGFYDAVETQIPLRHAYQP